MSNVDHCTSTVLCQYMDWTHSNSTMQWTSSEGRFGPLHVRAKCLVSLQVLALTKPEAR